jgi:murein DD-endopeptidase MepM/ murein hydrolase activator NlpD
MQLRNKHFSLHVTLCIAMVGMASCQSSRVVRERGQSAMAHLVMPVRGIMPKDLTPNFGNPRDNGARRHEGLDIMAPMDREILAPTGGRIIQRRWNALGGNSIWLEGDDGRFYYFAHLSKYASFSEGDRVRVADIIGYVGNTGDAQGKSPHLHFEIHDTRTGPAIDPYPILRQDGVLVMPLQVK